MAIPRRVSQAGLRITGSILELVFGTASDQPAAGAKLPGTDPVDTSNAVAGDVLTHDGDAFVTATRGVAAAVAGTVQTTTADATTVASYKPDDGTVVCVRATINARKGDGSVAGTWIVTNGYRRAATTTTELDTPTELMAAVDGGAGAWAATLDASGSDVRVRVTGAGATTIDWAARLEIVAIAP